MTVLVLIISTVCAFTAGTLIACLACTNKISDMRQELDDSISMDRFTYCLHDSLMPNKMKNSSIWNAALLDLQQRVEKAVNNG